MAVGFIRIAEKTAAPVVPIHIKRELGIILSNRKTQHILSMLMLPRE